MCEIVVAKSAGFCFGVERAIGLAYDQAKKNIKSYTYGFLIHNKVVTDELEKKGISVIENLDGINEGAIIIRSHGVGKEVYDEINEKKLELIDGTCPHVRKIHNIVYKEKQEGNKIIILGDKNHAEIQGILGWCDNQGIVINALEEINLQQWEENTNYSLVVQTTFNRFLFENMINLLKNKKILLKIFNTICSATEIRQKEALELSRKMDNMVVVGDKKSSNTQKLVEICEKNCKKTIYIETICDFSLNSVEMCGTIGLTAGASTPSVIIKEVVYTMSKKFSKQLEERSKSGYGEDFERMLDESLIVLRTGDVVKGTVIQVINEEVSVNLGYKSDGVIPRNEFSSDTAVVPSSVVQAGDEIEVFVVRVNDGDGNVLLSKKRIEAQKGMEDIEIAYNEKTVITGLVTEVVKGGLIAVVNGARVFIPSSQVSNRFIEDLSVFKNKELDFHIIEMDRVKRRVIGGRKALVEKEIASKKAALFEKIEAGSKIKGSVSRLTAFGAFVDLGGVDGLIHISEMSWGRISDPKELLKEGQAVEVFVLDVDKEKGKISLSLKDGDLNPWKLAIEKYSVGTVVEGKVVRMVPFGAFVELEAGVDGLVHISQIANKHVVKPEDELKVGEVVTVKVLEVNAEQKKISLSKRQAEAPETTEEATTEEA